MAMTTPRTRPESDGSDEAGTGYGTLDHPRRSQGRGRGWLLLAPLVLIGGGLALWLLRPGSTADPSSAQPTTPTTATTTTTSAPTSTTAAPTTIPEPPAGWSIGGDLIDYIDEPVFSEPGTPEAAVEIAFVNSEIAASRALANPSFEEDELAVWQTGFTLSGTRDSMRVLVERGQVLLTGPLMRLEVENITFLNETEADLEYCALLHSINVVTDGSAEDFEDISTYHGVLRFVRAPDGHWQSYQLIRTIQDIKGFGECLDVTLEPVELPAELRGQEEAG